MIDMEIQSDARVAPVRRAAQQALASLRSYFSALACEAPAPWNATTVAALLSLVAIWAAWFYGTWATWGLLTVDCGREMYVPLVLSEGKTLYKDIWYPYGPAAPYFNSYLYRLFGVHLNTLYWAGSLSSLISSLLLYLVGMRLSSWFVGWTAGAVLLTESFHRSLFSFPLPYSFASVYGCVIACLFLWFVIRASCSKKPGWVFGAGTAAAVGLLLKLEVGVACYAGLALLIAALWFRDRSLKQTAKDLGVCLPGVAVCIAVVLWMISLRGAEFLIQENIQAWPTSYFMRTFGKFWLQHTGLSLSADNFLRAARRSALLFVIFQGLYLLFSWKGSTRRRLWLRIALLFAVILALVTYLASLGKLTFEAMPDILRNTVRYIFFPQDMVLYVCVVGVFAWWYFWRNPDTGQSAAVALTLTFSVIFAARILLRTEPVFYSIFYDGPAILCYLLLARQLIHRLGASRRSMLAAEGAICVLCLIAALANRQDLNPLFPATGRITTERGTIRVDENLAQQYRAAIQFMQEKNALGQQVLLLPEDTSLYFLSETHCPLRVCIFLPGLVVPGKMTDELIQQIETADVRYLVWSNRTFPEFGLIRFGYDFDQTLGQYFFSHYHPMRPLVEKPVRVGEWSAFIWERNAEARH